SLTAGRLGGGISRHGCGLSPLLAGKGVGVARIDDKHPRRAATQILPAEIHGRRWTLRTGENAGHRRARLEYHGEQVRSVPIFDARFRSGDAHAFDRRHARIFFRRERGDLCGHQKPRTDMRKNAGLPHRRDARKGSRTALPRRRFDFTVYVGPAEESRRTRPRLLPGSYCPSPSAASTAFFKASSGISTFAAARASLTIAKYLSRMMAALACSFTCSKGGGCCGRLSSTFMICHPNCVCTGSLV